MKHSTPGASADAAADVMCLATSLHSKSLANKMIHIIPRQSVRNEIRFGSRREPTNFMSEMLFSE